MLMLLLSNSFWYGNLETQLKKNTIMPRVVGGAVWEGEEPELCGPQRIRYQH